MQKRRNFVIMVVIIAVIGVLVLAGERGSGRHLMLDDLEGELNKQTVDYGADAASLAEVSASTETKYCGKQSLKLSYRLEANGYMFCARGYGLDALAANKWSKQPEQIDWSRYQGFSFMVSSSQRTIVAFDVKDASGEIWRYEFPLERDLWQEIKVPFNQLVLREDWQPQTAARDKVLNFPIKSYQWEPRTPGEGELYFDCVKLLRNGPAK